MERYRTMLALFVLLCASTAGAARVALFPGVSGLENVTLNLNVLLQTWITSVEDQAPNGTGWNTQAFIRRSRIAVSGDINKHFHFFLQLDNPNFGRYSVTDPTGLTGRFFLLDAQAIYEPVPGIFIEIGQLLLPLSHQQIQGATTFLTFDIHSNTIRFPGATAPNQATSNLREPGIEIRGWLLEKRLGFRLGVYNGVRGAQGPYDPNMTTSMAGLNPDGLPQIGGYLHWNFLDSEERGWLYQGMYFNTKPILSIGFGAGYQAKAIRNVPGFTTKPQDWRALAADVFLDLQPGPEQEFIFQADGYNYDFGDHNPNTGNGFFVEIGYRLGEVQPQVSYEFFQANDVRTNDARIWTVGINWWFRRLNCLKLELQGAKTGNLALTPTRQVGVQLQLFF